MIERSLKDILENKFSNSTVEVINESHLHAGHAGSPGTGQSHFKILIVADEFEGHSKISRHRMVNTAVQPLFDEGLHALSLVLFTKNEYIGNR